VAKELTSKDSVSTPRTAAEAGLRRLRQGFVYDKFGIKTKFQAQVLTRPISTTGREKKSDITLQYAKFMYKARILGNPSPHDYLPDPCDASLAIKQKEALKLIGFHTTFISNSDFARDIQDPPKIGDIVDVRLEPGKHSYDLQAGTHLGTINLNNATVRDPAEGTRTLVSCESLTDLFGEGNVPVMNERRRSKVVAGGSLTDPGATARIPSRAEIDYGAGTDPPKRFEQFDKEYNLWRSGQPTAKQLAWIIDTYDIKYVVRMNENEGGMVMADEKGVCDAKSCVYNFGQSGTPTYIDAHSGYKRFQGFTSSKREVFEIFKKKNVLVHCSAGKDRTGYIVAAWIDKRVRDDSSGINPSDFPSGVSSAINETDNTKRREVLWQYTIAFNNWGGSGGHVCAAQDGRGNTNWGYGRYLDGFYPLNEWCNSTIGSDPSDRKKCRICDNLDQYK
jgi:hypothetical protein